jgi:hypothetical protein
MKIADFETSYVVPYGAAIAELYLPDGSVQRSAVNADEHFNVEGEYEFQCEPKLRLRFVTENKQLVEELEVPPRVCLEVDDEPELVEAEPELFEVEPEDIVDVLREGGFNAFEISPGTQDVEQPESPVSEDAGRGVAGK